ncbi:MAG: NUDIX domain-containing protein [Bacteroidota bacterium]
MPDFRFCPVCATPLTEGERGGAVRQCCPNPDCGWVYWDNPVPVVGAVVERNGHVVLIQNVGWPKHFFGLVTGFLEKVESPEEAVLREVKEETGLDGTVGEFLGLYPFKRRNQILMIYHVSAHEGEITIDPEEIADYREVPIEKVRPWNAGTGLALEKWLNSRGHFPEPISLR